MSCGTCNAEVSATSKFCWKCGVDLATVARPLLADDRWARRPGEFAVLAADQDIKGWLAKPLIIEHGTRAMLFQAGKFKGEIGEGRYDMGGFFKRLVHLSPDLAATVVICDAGDITIDLENGNLWTADKIEVGTTVRLVLRIQDPDAMFVNLFKGHGCIGVDEIELQLAGEVQMLLSGIVAEHEAEELFTNVEARNGLEARLRETIEVTLSRLGLELVQLRFISFSGEAYEEIRSEAGELRVEEGRAGIREGWTKLHMRLRDTESQDKMDECKSSADLKDFIDQTLHEMKLKGFIRADEIDRLAERFEFERNRESVLRRIEIQAIEDDSDRNKAWLSLLAEERRTDEAHKRNLDRQLADAQNEQEIAKVRLEMTKLEHVEHLRQRHEEHIQDMIEARDGMDNLQRVTQIEEDQADRRQQREAAALEARSKATAEALLSGGRSYRQNRRVAKPAEHVAGTDTRDSCQRLPRGRQRTGRQVPVGRSGPRRDGRPTPPADRSAAGHGRQACRSPRTRHAKRAGADGAGCRDACQAGGSEADRCRRRRWTGPDCDQHANQPANCLMSALRRPIGG
jgi:hypothetical protein